MQWYILQKIALRRVRYNFFSFAYFVSHLLEIEFYSRFHE
jgi:hypothetical protein